MKFAIITHVPHGTHNEGFFAYAPYVREMNIWLKYVDEVHIVAPLELKDKTNNDINYEHKNIVFTTIQTVNIQSVKAFLLAVVLVPRICLNIYKAMRSSDHIHLRCPGNIGLLGCLIQILFRSKPKTAKYAGNWDPRSRQPWSYRLQKWILSSTFLTKNIQVLVYGQWKGMSGNIKSFFTASYYEIDKSAVVPRKLNEKMTFLFVGTFSSGKRPLYAVQIVESLIGKGYNVELRMFGWGIQQLEIENYINTKELGKHIVIEGVQSHKTVKKAFQESHFVLLPSRSEGWPKVIAEGMFWGCLPISSNVSCLKYMLDDGNRGLIIRMNLEDDVEQIKKMIEDQLKYNTKVLESIAWSRKFTLDLFESEIKGFLNS